MAEYDPWGEFVSPETEYSFPEFAEPTYGWEIPGVTTPYVDPSYMYGTGAPAESGFSMGGLLSALGSNPSLLGAILGGLGPLAGLAGGLASGGQVGSQSGFSNQSGTSQGQTVNTGMTQGTSSYQNQQGGSQTQGQTGQQAGTQFGYSQPFLLPGAQAAAGNAQAALGAMSPFAMPAYQQGLGLLQGPGAAMAAGQSPYSGMQQDVLAQLVGMSNQPGYTFQSMNLNIPELQGIVSRAYDPMVQGMVKQAITGARAAGFSGGAELLNTAAAPIAGPMLAQVPGMEANSLLNLITTLPYQNAQIEAMKAQAANSGRQTGISGLAAALNGLQGMSGQQLQALGLVAPALMGPQQQQFAGNAQLFGMYPYATGQTGSQTGSQSQNMFGQYGQTGSGSSAQQGSSNQINTANNVFNQSGNTGQSASQPMGNIIGQGIGNLLLGAATGIGAYQNNQTQGQFNQALLDYLNRH